MSEELNSGSDAYWPSWVNYTAPVCIVLAFLVIIAVLYKIKVPPTPEVR